MYWTYPLGTKQTSTKKVLKEISLMKSGKEKKRKIIRNKIFSKKNSRKRTRGKQSHK
jgi:hypothetical protein